MQSVAPGTTILDYQSNRGGWLGLRRRAAAGFGSVLGLGSGISWLIIGDWMAIYLGNKFTWFILPFLIPLLLMPMVVVLSRVPQSRRIVSGLLFYVCFIVAHWTVHAAAFAVLIFMGPF